MSSYLLHDCKIETNKNQLLNTLNVVISEKQFFQPIVTLNVTMFPEYENAEDLFQWLRDNALFTPDGISISLMVFKKYRRWVKRFPGIDMVHELFYRYSGYNVVMIGASADINLKATHYFKRVYPNHRLVFSIDGYVSITQKIFDQIVKSKPDVILVAMGCPKQDELLKDLSVRLKSGIGIGVGGVFDVWAQSVKRAPLLFRLMGLEWLFRIIKEPFRMKRILKSLKYFFK